LYNTAQKDKLSMHGLGAGLPAAVISPTFLVRRVLVDRSRTPEDMIAETGRVQLVEPDVVAAIPRGGEEGLYLCFFQPNPDLYLNGSISDDCLEDIFAFRKLQPADP